MNNAHAELLVKARENTPQSNHHVIENVNDYLTEIWDDIRLDEYDRIDEHIEDAVGELEYAQELGLGDTTVAIDMLKEIAEDA